MKLRRQIIIIILLAAFFAAVDLGIYFIFTRRCINPYNSQIKSDSIEVEKYLPFDENSEIIKVRADLTLDGDVPVIDGAAALFPVYSAFVNACYPSDSVGFENGEFSPDSAMQYRNTLRAYKALADGDADIVICAAPSEEQVKYAANKGVEFELVPIGREGFVFIVNADNPIDDLTDEQLRGIYSGKYRSWKQLGGKNKPIGAVRRINGSGSQSVMEKFMVEEPILPDYDVFMGSCIAYTFRYYVQDVIGEGGVKMLSVNGVYPDTQSISDGSYPLTCQFYAVYRKGDDDPNIKRLIDWILSDQGQEIIEKSGYSRLVPES